MMKKHLLFWALIPLLALSSCFLPRMKEPDSIYKSDTLIIEKIANNVYVHISFIDVTGYGPFPCNGMIVVDENQAFVFDTPTTNSVSNELLNWIEKDLQKEVIGLMIHHFHEDCMGGLEEFKKHGIPSYASQLTFDLLQENEEELPTDIFQDSISIPFGKTKLITRFFGEGHTKDNVVSYFPSKELLFGGCLVKEVNASKGNLADANVSEWPLTITQIQKAYPTLKLIVPGHGKVGGLELLDYTKELFSGN
ncbi:MAG: subclass B1 metallo-beta-lactamase [Crocinitomicaceae bacterium]|jgi:metallo-beta-lactamase class B|nr:subclass B1 metallo-beta-lactamase [Crocinitomicaceae bacterium]